MTTRELIRAEIENLPEENLGELYRMVRHFAQAKATPARKLGTLSSLKQIKIQGPEDFAANLDQYSNGEKQLAPEQDLR